MEYIVEESEPENEAKGTPSDATPDVDNGENSKDVRASFRAILSTEVLPLRNCSLWRCPLTHMALVLMGCQ